MSLYDHFSSREQEILQARARRVAQVATSGNATDWLEALLVRLRGETYALPVESVLAVYEGIPITPLPGTPEFVAGIANVRGHLMTVLNLAAILNAPGEEPSGSRALVVVANGDFSVALCVERADEVSNIDNRELSSKPALSETLRGDYLVGVLPDGVALLDVRAMLDDPALVVNHSSSV